MRKTIIFIGIFISLLAIGVNAQQVQRQDLAKGKVVMNLNKKVVPNVIVGVNDQKEVISDKYGLFAFINENPTQRPEKVVAYREGFEVANWEFEHEVLTVYMRKATIKTIEGTLTINGSRAPNQLIVFKGDEDYKAATLEDGHFSLKVPYEHKVDANSEFFTNDLPLKITSMIEDRTRGRIDLELELVGYQPNKGLATVKVVDSNQKPYKRTIVTVAGVTFITTQEGTFSVDNISLKEEDWIIEGRHPLSVTASRDRKSIEVVMHSNEILASNGAEGIDTTAADGEVDNIFATEINDLIEFYNLQASEIERRNQKITFLIDSLATLTHLDTLRRAEYLSQVDNLTQSLDVTTSDFGELKWNSIVLIERLQNLLRQQEEKIRLIELEKERQAEKFRNDLLFVLSILGLASLLVVILVFIAKRISARKKVVERVKNQLDEAQTIAKLASMTYFIKNKQHQYSDHFFNILGIKNENRIKQMQRTTEKFIHNDLLENEEHNKVNEAIEQSLETKKPLFMELKVKSDDNKEVFVDLRSKIEENGSGKPVAISSTLQDVTEKKEREFQLIEAKTAAEIANREKEDFLSTMSHEIRTPLNGIVGLTNHLIGSEPPKHLEENLKTLKFSADHLLSLVNDVLDYNKIQAGKMVLSNKTFNLKEHMESTVKAMSLIASHKDIKLKLGFSSDLPDMVRGDKVRLNQVITNLLNNAIKFTDNGSVELEISKVKSTKEKVDVYFKVKDTGIGIESSKLDKIFESFEQEDITTSNKYGGTGLGLAISQQLVKLFGGELAVKSKQGKGSEFYFTIPFTLVDESKVNGQKNSSSKLAPADFSKLNILCVEDNEVNQLVISQYFENWKINYAFAVTGEEALDKFRKEDYDIVFMDINLPDKQGDEVVMKMKEEFPYTNCVFLALTAETGEPLHKAIDKCGMVGFLNKPFSNEELEAIISKHGNKKKVPN